MTVIMTKKERNDPSSDHFTNQTRTIVVINDSPVFPHKYPLIPSYILLFIPNTISTRGGNPLEVCG